MISESADMIESYQAFMAHLDQATGPDAQAAKAAAAHNARLTKPPGALGSLEDLAIWYASWRGTEQPQLTNPQIVIFAGNHGIARHGVSAFPADVTEQMVANFQAGGAAINQLAKLNQATLHICPLWLDRATADFTQGPAMSTADCLAALQTGWDAVRPDSDLLIVGEMGIGNTTAAAAIVAALLGGTAADWAGRGTGVDDGGLLRKQQVIDQGLAVNTSRAPLDVLAAFGGFEIAAMAGSMARARKIRIPVVLDGFICCAAALVLHKINPQSLDHAVAGHLSAETAHRRLLQAIDKDPIVSLGLRLGEGSGAALALCVLKAALACHSGMATFEQAGVSDG